MSEVVKPNHLSEAALVQNEALGAFAMWKFGLGYQDRNGQAAVLPLAFLVLPIILHGPTLAMVLSTHKASGLHLFAGKLGDRREELLAIHDRALALKRLTLESLVRAEQSGLVLIESSLATIWSISPHGDFDIPALPDRIRRFAPACEKLGYWFAGLTDQQVAHALRVEF